MSPERVTTNGHFRPWRCSEGQEGVSLSGSATEEATPMSMPHVLERPVEEARARLRLVQNRPEGALLVTVRTCAHCGEHTAFVRDPDGCWYSCVACGRYA
jgi:hypothetical protein